MALASTGKSQAPSKRQGLPNGRLFKLVARRAPGVAIFIELEYF